MPITRLPLETELQDRVGALMVLVSKVTTPTGTQVSYTGPIGFAIQRLGTTPATPGFVTDSDLAAIDDSLFYTIADLAEFRLIRSCLNNFTEPDQAISLGRQDLDKMMRRFADQADKLEAQYAGLLNIRQNPTRIGKIHQHWPTPGHRDWSIGHNRLDH